MRTLTSRARYTLSLLGAVRCVFLLRPPATMSIPCTSRSIQLHIQKRNCYIDCERAGGTQGAPW